MELESNERAIVPVRHWRTTGNLSLNMARVRNMETYKPGDEIYWALFHVYSTDGEKAEIISGSVPGDLSGEPTPDEIFIYVLNKLQLIQA